MSAMTPPARPSVPQFADAERPIRERPIIHEAAEWVGAQLAGSSLEPVRDGKGTIAYRVDAPLAAFRGYVAAKVSPHGGFVSINETILTRAQAEGRQVLLVVMGGSAPRAYLVDVVRALLTGYGNRYNRQQMCNFVWNCCHPWHAGQEPTGLCGGIGEPMVAAQGPLFRRWAGRPGREAALPLPRPAGSEPL